MTIKALIISCCLLTALCSTGQHLDLVKYASGDKLPFANTYYIAQDKDGFLYFTAGKEVYRYDGNTFNRLPASNSCSIGFISKIKQAGNELYFFDNTQLLRLDRDSLVPVATGDDGSSVADITFCNGNVYLISEKGLFRKEEAKSKKLSAMPGGRFMNQGQQLVRYNDSLLLCYNPYDRLIAFNIHTRQSASMRLPVMGLTRDKEGNCMALLERKGFYRISNCRLQNTLLAADTTCIYRSGIPAVKNVDLLADSSGNLWTNIYPYGLLCLTPGGRLLQYDENAGLSGTLFARLFVDRENNLWIAATNGIFKHPANAGERFMVTEGLFANDIMAMLYDTLRHTIWLSSSKGINSISNNIVSRNYAFSGSKDGSVRKMILYKNGVASFNNNSLYYFDAPGRNSDPVRQHRLAQLQASINDIAAEGKSLLTATDKGLFIYHEGNTRKVSDDDLSYRVIKPLDNGFLIAGLFNDGILLLAPEDRHYQVVQAVTKLAVPATEIGAVRSITVDHLGRIWVGTRLNGLFCFTLMHNALQPAFYFGKTDLFNNPVIWEITEKKPGELLLTTSTGVYELDMNNAQPAIVKARQFPEHVQVDRFVADNDGTLWLNTPPGITKLPAAVDTVHANYKTFITSFYAATKPLMAASKKIGYNDDPIEITFTSNYLADEQRVLYSYILEGKGNAEWSNPAASHSAALYGLSPGHYTFRVKAILPGGREVEEAAIEFIITPPFWLTWWFIALCAVMLAALMYAIYRYRVQQLLKLERMRTAISSDLHDEVGATLSSISIYSNVAKKLAATDHEKAGEYLTRIEESSRKMIGSMSDIVWSINPANDDMDKILLRMRSNAQELAGAADMGLQWEEDEKIGQLKLSMEQRKNFYLFFKEAINNAAKYSKAAQLQVTLQYRRRFIQLLVKDNGIGFNDFTEYTGNGLKNMQQRAGLLGGKFSLRSYPQKGTVITLTFPI